MAEPAAYTYDDVMAALRNADMVVRNMRAHGKIEAAEAAALDASKLAAMAQNLIQTERATPDLPEIERPTGRISASRIAEREQQPFPAQPKLPEGYGLPQGIKEGALPTIGTGAGALLGSVLGPGGTATGAMLGGAGGEVLNQKLGITPPSRQAMGISAIAGPVGMPLGKGAQYTRRVARGGIMRLPPVKQALAIKEAEAAFKEFDTVGGHILAQQTGGMKYPAKSIYRAVEKSGVTIPADSFQGAVDMADKLITDFSPHASYPAVKSAINIAENMKSSFGKSGDPLSMTDIIENRKQLGLAVRQAEGESGTRFYAAKALFSKFDAALDDIAAAGGQTGDAAKVAKLAAKRAKLEFAVSDVENMVARHSKVVPGEEATALDLVGLRQEITDVMNPKHSNYNKNFAAAMKDTWPDLRKRMIELEKFTQKTGVAGGMGGSLVIRGATAQLGRQVMGGLLGNALGGPLTAVSGALIGAQAPEMITAALLQPRAAAALARFARIGRGDVPYARWATVSQGIVQSLMQRRPNRERQTVRGIQGTPAELSP